MPAGTARSSNVVRFISVVPLVVLLAPDRVARRMLIVTDLAPFVARDVAVAHRAIALRLDVLLLLLEPIRFARRDLAVLHAVLDPALLRVLAMRDLARERARAAGGDEQRRRCEVRLHANPPCPSTGASDTTDTSDACARARI